jgi:alpha-beta hydrolase superfamily lysophospholipase
VFILGVLLLAAAGAGAEPGQPFRESGVLARYTGAGGARLGYFAYRAPRGNGAAVVYLHGIESHAGWFGLAAERLRGRGYDVFALDRRGSGVNQASQGFVPGHAEDWRVLVEDVHAFVAPLGARYASVFLAGLSWGGKLAVAYALAHRGAVDGLALITPGLVAKVDPPLADKAKIVAGAALRPTARVPTPIDPPMFTTTPRYLAYIEGDPLRLTSVTAKFFWETRRLDRHIAANVASLRLPVLLLLAGKDRIIDNAATRELLTRATGAALEVVDYPEQTHSVQFDDPDRLVTDMDRWMRRYRATGTGGCPAAPGPQRRSAGSTACAADQSR